MHIPTVHLICNAHLDPVWQWRWEEGCAEALSTFSTAVELLAEHPGLIFNHNEAVLYQWVQEYDPSLFAKIQALVEAGRWCISGGWLLQPDVNLPDTESLIRHILMGRRFFRQHFGVDPRVAYNFDSFGHSAGLPQLLVRTGYQMYIHMRPQASDLQLPSDLYRWRGLDGSEIAALRISVGLYHTERDNIEQRLREGTEVALALNRDVPVFWGIGNHGGGPTREDLKRIDAFIQAEKRVNVIHSTPERLYEALKSAAASASVFEGDLQRVFTGCYTSLARVKRQAVKSLGGLVQTEALRAITALELGQEYPAAQLESCWRDHLFNDFHDILPGSCTEPAEQDALGLYSKVADNVRRLRLGAATAFNAGPKRPCYIPVTVLNANPGFRLAPVEVECMLELRPKWSGKWHLRLFTPDGKEVPCQEEQPESLLPYNGWRRKVCFVADLPALGAKHYKLEIQEGEPARQVGEAALPHQIEPQTGLVTALAASPGASGAGLKTESGSQLVRGPLLKALVVEDSGDSWGTDHWSYRNVLGAFECIPGSVTQLAAGPIRTITESVHQFGASRIVYHIIAYAALPLLEFRLRIYWQEERRRLKLSIPTVFSAKSVLCEVPGGVWHRPTDGQEHVHRRWLLVEGVVAKRPTALAVIHEGLHGFDVQDGEIRLSVLRSAAYCHEHTFPLSSSPARKFMDQGLHDVRLLVTVGDPAHLRATITGLADWLAAPPAAYSHLPIGGSTDNCIRARSAPPQLMRTLDALLTCEGVRMLACTRSHEADAVLLRVQEIAGSTKVLKVPAGACASGSPLELHPYEIKTLRVDSSGAVREVNIISAT